MHDRDLSPIAVVSDFPFRGEEVGGAWKTMDVASKHTITVLYSTPPSTQLYGWLVWACRAGVDVIRSRSPRRPTCRHCSLVRARATIHDASLPSFLCCHNQSETTRSAATASRAAGKERKHVPDRHHPITLFAWPIKASDRPVPSFQATEKLSNVFF
jgi:hypothetical protein